MVATNFSRVAHLRVKLASQSTLPAGILQEILRGKGKAAVRVGVPEQLQPADRMAGNDLQPQICLLMSTDSKVTRYAGEDYCGLD